MTLTIEELKNKYCKIAVEKGNAIYSSWGKNGTTSKKLVTQANEYAFDKRLQTDGVFRLQVIAFAYALEVRLEKRYGTFWRKLFRLFAFLRERGALKMLKRVLGFPDGMDIREMMEMETEEFFSLLSQRLNQNRTGGGKHSLVEDVSVEELLENLLEEYALEVDEKTAKQDFQADNAELLTKKGEPSLPQKENAEREKVSTAERKNNEAVDKEKKTVEKDIKIDPSKKAQTERTEKELPEQRKEERPVEKSVANTSILAEMMFAEQQRAEEPPSPFPVFRETDDRDTAVEKKDDEAVNKELDETNFAKETCEGADMNIHTDTAQGESSFPVFNNSQKGLESLLERGIKELKEITALEMAGISEENKARIALNITLSDEQRKAIVMQLKEAAKIVMEKEERAWREKIAVAEEGKTVQMSVNNPSPPQNNGKVIQNLKK